MRGAIIGVWPETWREIWSKLGKHPEYGDDLFSDLYRELVPEPRAPQAPPTPVELTAEGELTRPEDIAARDAYLRAFERYEDERARYEEAVSGGYVSRRAFRAVLKDQITREADAIMALERAFSVIVGYGDEPFRNKYFLLNDRFLRKYNLRYDLRRPFTLHPTLSGVFAKLVEEMKAYSMRDAHLHQLMQDFEEALRDLRDSPTPSRMKTCMQKEFNLIEGIGQRCPGVTANTLGDICGQVRFWPHATLKEAVKKLYGFRSNYPGLGHAGNPQSVLREIEMRDLVAVSVVLAGFSPYLTDQINSHTVYSGS